MEYLPVPLSEAPIASPLLIGWIQNAVAVRYRVRKADLLGPRRVRYVSNARAVAMFLSRELTECSYPMIGHLFGDKDHSTVLYACRKVARQAKSDPHLRSLLDAVRKEVGGEVATGPLTGLRTPP